MTEKGKRRLRDGRELSVHANRGLRKICACPRHTWAKCPHGWHFRYALKGRHCRFSLAKHAGHPITSRTEAKATADWIRTAIREGTLVVGRQAGSRKPYPTEIVYDRSDIRVQISADLR